MVGRKTGLGDSHNFGRRVVLRGDRVAKPRTVFWEWLVLSPESPLRQSLDSAVLSDGLKPDFFGFLPSLEFYRWRDGPSGEVEHAVLSPLGKLSREGRRELAEVVGRSLALWSWLGVADLHWENLILGKDARKRLVFGPLDVEMMLADVGLPTETKLLPDADPEYAVVCQHAAGVRRVLPYLGKPIEAPDLLAMLAAYGQTLAFLERHATAIGKTLAALPQLHTAPLRVLLRSTGEYVHARTEPPWPPLLDAEQEQLARGDIPYFFRLYGKRGIHYYADETLEQLGHLPLKGDVPQLDALLDVSRALRSPQRGKLRTEGLLTIVGAFDHPSLSGRHHGDELSVTFGPRTLVVALADGEELHSRRNLRAFVSSVYLPCRCGEVRSVFVPAATRCETGAGAV
jgi:hypothetical protein